VNMFFGLSIAEQWVRAMWCEMIGVCGCFLLWNEVDDSSNLFVTWRVGFGVTWQSHADDGTAGQRSSGFIDGRWNVDG
jgi:hypothetical protein